MGSNLGMPEHLFLEKCCANFISKLNIISVKKIED